VSRYTVTLASIEPGSDQYRTQLIYDGENELAAMDAWRQWQRPAGSLPTTRYWVDLTEHVPPERVTVVDPTNLRGTKTRHP
jgi:hypothetical protein